MTDESTRARAAALPAPSRGITVGGELRSLAVAAVLRDGESIAATARRFGLGKTTVFNWVQRFRERGHVRPDPRGGKPSRIEPERERILRILAERPEISITGLRNALAAEGAMFAISTVRRFLRNHGLHPETRGAPRRRKRGSGR